MALIRTIVPDLVGGVTRQPDVSRFPNQFQECDNTFLHFSVGLEKRRGSDFVANLTNISGDLFFHWVERSASQRYFFVIKNDATTPLTIYKVDGTPCTITYNNSPAGTATALKNYLATAPANLRAVSFDDTTIIVNTTVVVTTVSTSISYLFPASTGTPVENSGNFFHFPPL